MQRWHGKRHFFVLLLFSVPLFMAKCGSNGVSISPSGLAAPADITADAGKERVTLTWSPVAGAASYNIYYATSSSVSKESGTKIANLSGSLYMVRPLSNKTPYYFRVTAVNAGGESGDSPWATATPLAEAPKPGLVRIPAGSFQMGDNLDNTGYAQPVHAAEVDEF
jgi:formylglycine-generating enzyme required for sulfatase activity